LDSQGNLRHIIKHPAPTINSNDGRYESSALDYVEIAEQVLKECVAHTLSTPPLGLCSQRSSFLIWDKTSGKPITPLISWQDNRGASYCERLHASSDIIHKVTGLQLSAYYFAPKLGILLQENPGWREKLASGKWLTGTLDTFLIWRWTQKQHFLTDASMAARTLLMDIYQQQWSDVLCGLFDIPRTILPQIKPSVRLNLPLDIGLTLQASVGDQSAALIASLTDTRTEALINLGTGGFVIRCLAEDSNVLSGYLQTLLYRDEKQHVQFAMEGTLNSIAAALAPYSVKDCRSEDLANNHIFCLAEPSGLGAPYFRKDWGIYFSQSVANLTAQQITALMLEAIIFRVARILEDFHRQSPLTQAYLSGGLSELICLQEGIAQCVTFPVLHLQQKEASLLGAALLACQSKIDIGHTSHTKEIAIPQRNSALLEKYRHWKNWFDILLKIDKN
jgi:glycerol kinase